MQRSSDPKQPLADQPRKRSVGEQLFSRPIIWILLTALLLTFVAIWGYRILREMRYADQSAKAMAECHNTPQGEAYRMEAVSNLAEIMPQLSFDPIFPQRIEKLQPVFIHARYCDISGRNAVHLRLKSNAGVGYSHFQIPLTPTDPKLRDSELIGEGVMVRLWQQDGLLMGLVGKR